MKRFIYLFALVTLAFTMHAKEPTYALAVAFSKSTASVDDVEVSFVGRKLQVKNNSDVTIYIDKRATHINENGIAYDLSENNLTIEAPISIGPHSKMDIRTVMNGFGMREFDVKNMSATPLKYEKNLFIFISDKENKTSLTKSDKKLLNIIDKLYGNLGEKQNVTSSEIHFTENESVIQFSAHIKFSTSENMSNAKTITLSSWASDMVLARATLGKQENKTTKGFAVDEEDDGANIVHMFADPVFETIEDVSPVTIFSISLNYDKGKVKLSHPIDMKPLKFLHIKNNLSRIKIYQSSRYYKIQWEKKFNLQNKDEKKEYENRMKKLD